MNRTIITILCLILANKLMFAFIIGLLYNLIFLARTLLNYYYLH